MRTKPAAMLWELIGRLANTNLTIRISGELGVGKEAIARLLRGHYPHKNALFKKFNCMEMGIAANPDRMPKPSVDATEKLDRALAEPENTVFYLEHIEALPVTAQANLHDMLNRHYPKAPPWVFVSSIEPLENHRLQDQIGEQLFNALDIIHIALPPLRKQPDRIPQILSWLLRQADSDDTTASAMAMPDLKSMQRIIQYHWPGNWRQLQQVALEAIHSNEWRSVVDCLEGIDVDGSADINAMATIHILSSAKLNIHKDRVMDGLMAASNLEEVGMLDLAIYNEAVTQIADHLSISESGEDPEPDPTSNS